MANTKSAEKAIRASARKAAHNRPIRSGVRTAVTKARQAIPAGGDAAAEAVRQAASALDKAAQKGVMHRNTAARKKSRLMKRLHALTAAASA